MSVALTKKEIDDIIILFKTDSKIQELLFKYDIFMTTQEEIELATLLLNNADTINNNTISELYEMEEPFLRNELNIFFGVDMISKDIYERIFYVFKYSTIKKFFKDNWTKFMPDFDALNIQDNEKMVIFQEAFMQEFDRFSQIIDKIYDIMDIDSIPSEYLNYIAQLIGYERSDDILLSNVSFRELLKNIIEVYKIKGTNYSFELFFNFLGFEVSLKEYWFDKRFYYGVNTNPETGVIDRDKAEFYLTSTKPTDYIPENMNPKFLVTEDELTETLDINNFNKMIELGKYSVRQLLGIDLGYAGTKYEYFKTNVMEYTLSSIIVGEESSLTPEQNKVIKQYSDFLTPIFIKNNILVIIPAFEDDGTSLFYKDKDYSIYEINYMDNKNDELHDTEDRFYKRTHTTNAPFYLAVADEYGYDLSYDENKILEKISELMDGSSEHFWNDVIPTFYDTGKLFESFIPLRRREIFYPYIDTLIYTLTSGETIKEEFKTTNVTLGADFSIKKAEIKRLSEATSISNDMKANVLNINATTNIITIEDPDDTFTKLAIGSYIKLFNLVDRVGDGGYKISSISKSGEDTLIEINNLDTPYTGVSQGAGGFLQVYEEDWKLGKCKYPFLFDRVFKTS